MYSGVHNAFYLNYFTSQVIVTPISNYLTVVPGKDVALAMSQIMYCVICSIGALLLHKFEKQSSINLSNVNSIYKKSNINMSWYFFSDELLVLQNSGHMWRNRLLGRIFLPSFPLNMYSFQWVTLVNSLLPCLLSSESLIGFLS